MDTLRETARVVTSKPVQRAVVNTALLAVSSITLLGLAGIASALFFHSYVPDRAISSPVYLQYGLSEHPYGVATLAPPRPKTQQEYDISVSLSMPRSPANLDRGNFMVSLYLVDAAGTDNLLDKALVFANERGNFGSRKILFKSRRPALVPYMDPVVSLAKRVVLLAYHMFFPTSQILTMDISLAEKVEFFKQSLVPASAYVEVEAGQDIQIYKAELTLTARLRGLRWLMFHYRLITYIIFTLLFWLFEMLFMGGTWVVWVAVTSPVEEDVPPKGRRAIDGGDGDSSADDGEDDYADGDEGSDASDEPHLPSNPRKAVAFKREVVIKGEDDQEALLSDIPLASPGVEADDEREFNDYEEDHKLSGVAGVGTGYNEQGSESIRKRPSSSRLE